MAEGLVMSAKVIWKALEEEREIWTGDVWSWAGWRAEAPTRRGEGRRRSNSDRRGLVREVLARWRERRVQGGR